MVTRSDIQLSMLPAECCSNCGFITKSTADANGSNGQTSVPITTDYERYRGLDEHDDAVWGGRRIATLHCWMRRDQEGPPTGSGNRAAVAETVALMHKDRSESGGGDYCPQFTPWVRHLDFREHWEERKLYLLERDRKQFEKSLADQQQAWQTDLEESRKKSEGGWNKRFYAVAIAGLLIAIAQVVAALITSGADVVVNLR